MSISTILGASEIGLIFAIMSLGIFITFKILNFPDLTVDGSFTLGCVVSALFALNGHPILAIFAATLAGSIAGFVTGFLHTKMKVQYILAGILTMTALYSINLKIAGGKPNFSLFNKASIFSSFQSFLEKVHAPAFLLEHHKLILILIIVIMATLLLYLFFKTQTGLAIRATGDNESMVKASSINTDAMKIAGLALANGFVGLAAAIFTQYQQFYDISLGIGMMVVGLTSIILGETIFGKRSLLNSFIALILGAIIYRILLAFALSLGMNPNDWKLLCSLLVATAISLPTIKTYIHKRRERYAKH
ncbi:MAG: ABC transporter permease [Erysipelotrichia bacterium]|nr:ABC transporter permease [Erysipelotrichia bacterium]NCC54932.1 ABC transporter permease [Erysipelotrichia bacterium]